jgi:hypothetical protein
MDVNEWISDECSDEGTCTPKLGNIIAEGARDGQIGNICLQNKILSSQIDVQSQSLSIVFARTFKVHMT